MQRKRKEKREKNTDTKYIITRYNNELIIDMNFVVHGQSRWMNDSFDVVA